MVISKKSPRHIFYPFWQTSFNLPVMYIVCFFFEPDPTTSTLLLLTLTTYQQLHTCLHYQWKKKVFLKLNGSSSQALPTSFFEIAVVCSVDEQKAKSGFHTLKKDSPLPSTVILLPPSHQLSFKKATIKKSNTLNKAFQKSP